MFSASAIAPLATTVSQVDVPGTTRSVFAALVSRTTSITNALSEQDRYVGYACHHRNSNSVMSVAAALDDVMQDSLLHHSSFPLCWDSYCSFTFYAVLLSSCCSSSFSKGHVAFLFDSDSLPFLSSFVHFWIRMWAVVRLHSFVRPKKSLTLRCYVPRCSCWLFRILHVWQSFFQNWFGPTLLCQFTPLRDLIIDERMQSELSQADIWWSLLLVSLGIPHK